MMNEPSHFPGMPSRDFRCSRLKTLRTQTSSNDLLTRLVNTLPKAHLYLMLPNKRTFKLRFRLKHSFVSVEIV